MAFVFQVDGFLYQDLEIAVTHTNYAKYFCMGSMLLLYDIQHTILISKLFLISSHQIHGKLERTITYKSSQYIHEPNSLATVSYI